MIFYPKLYLDNVKEITIPILQQYNIKGLILDMDNTLIDIDKNILEGVEEWVNNLKQEEIKLCILSNTNSKQKAEDIAKKLDIPYIYFAKKPLKKGFKKARELLQIKEENIAVVGDQILTDIIGANRSKMFSILVKPINERDFFITKIKRPLEEKIIKRYKKTREDENER